MHHNGLVAGARPQMHFDVVRAQGTCPVAADVVRSLPLGS